MRKLLTCMAVVVAFSSLSLLVRADDGEKITIKGMAQCGKCALKETKECQNVVVVKKDDAETKYFLVMNDVSKKAHQALGFCTAPVGEGPMVKVVGVCEDEDGKHKLTPETIEKVDE